MSRLLEIHIHVAESKAKQILPCEILTVPFVVIFQVCQIVRDSVVKESCSVQYKFSEDSGFSMAMAEYCLIL